MTTISQLQMRYSPEEDRVLLRVNTDSDQEFRFWLTRRFSLLLNQALAAHREADPDVSTLATEQEKQAVQAFKREDAQQKGDFQQSFKEANEYPLGAEPVLAYKLSYKVDGGNLNLSIEPRTGQGIKVVLNAELNFNVSTLLRQASDQANWQLETESATAEIPEDRVIN